jgi:hypothetical protein
MENHPVIGRSETGQIRFPRLPRDTGKAAPTQTKAGSTLGGMIEGDADRSRRYNRGDGVLVHHLRDRVLEQYDVLVEALNLALQLDAVDEIYGYRNVFFPQRVQEGVL